MKYATRIFSLLALSVSLILLAACGQSSNCSGISFGTGSGGGNQGGVNTGGSVCGAGSNNGGGGGSAADFVFYRGNNGTTNAINSAELTATTFQVLSGVSAAVGNSTTGNMVVVNKQFLYLPDQNSSGGVMGFQISHSSGALTAIAGSPFAAPHAVTAIAADPDSRGGRFLFVTDFNTGDVSTYTIDSTSGVLTLVTSSPVTVLGLSATSLNVDGTGSYLYATAGSTGGDVFGFLVDQNSGALSPVLGSPFALGAHNIQVSPDGAWVISTDGGNSVDVTPIEAGTGTLLTGSTTNFPTVNFVGNVALSPNGNFLYACNTKSAMEGFQFSGGALTALNGSPYTALSDIGGCQFDQSGTALFGIVVPSNSISVRIMDPANGNVAGGIADLPVATSNYFAVTN
ncbi:MAG TPA: beta-propeller fold lactonase family protein [Terriglobales bacterium]|nr:beta-propeller fold lactonase family protein [Terriglobales bacterium]